MIKYIIDGQRDARLEDFFDKGQIDEIKLSFEPYVASFTDELKISNGEIIVEIFSQTGRASRILFTNVSNALRQEIRNKFDFANAFWGRGGLASVESLVNGPFKSLMDSLRATCRDVLSQHPEINYHIDYVLNPKLAAAVRKRNGRYFIGINLGTVSIYYDLFNTLLANKNVLSDLGDSETEEDIKVYNIEITRPDTGKRLDFMDIQNARIDGEIIPKGIKRQAIAALLTWFAMEHLVCHELGHIINGHSDLVEEIGEPENEQSVSAENDLFLQTLEFDADSMAANLGIQLLLNAIKKDYPETNPFAEYYKSEQTSLRLWLFAVASAQRVLGSKNWKDVPLDRRTHPRFPVRQRFLYETVDAVLRKQRKEEQADLIRKILPDVILEIERAFQAVSEAELNKGASRFAFSEDVTSHIDRLLKNFELIRPQLLPFSFGNLAPTAHNNINTDEEDRLLWSLKDDAQIRKHRTLDNIIDKETNRLTKTKLTDVERNRAIEEVIKSKTENNSKLRLELYDTLLKENASNEELKLLVGLTEAQSFMDKGLFADSLKVFENVRKGFETFPAQPDYITAMIGEAVALKNLSNIALAISTLIQASKISDSLKYIHGVASANINLGDCYYHLGDLDNAIHYSELAVNAAETIDEFKIIVIGKITISTILRNQGNIVGAETLLLEAIQACKNLDDPAMMASCVGSLASIKLIQRNYDWALRLQKKALRLAIDSGNPYLIAKEVANVGNCMGYMNKKDIAVKYLSTAIKLNEKIGSIDGLPMSHGQLGVVYCKNGEKALGVKHLIKAIELYKSSGNEYMASRIQTNLEICRQTF